MEHREYESLILTTNCRQRLKILPLLKLNLLTFGDIRFGSRLPEVRRFRKSAGTVPEKSCRARARSGRNPYGVKGGRDC